MSLRDVKKQKTANEFMQAINRILEKKPICKELKKKLAEGKPLKLNPTNVEKEAGKSYNSTKNHTSVLNEIIRINNLKTTKSEATAKEINDSKNEKKEKNKEIKRLKDEIKSKNAEIEMLKLVNSNLHAHCRELTSALYNKIPQEDKERLFEKVNSIGSGNVVPIK